MRLRLLLSLVSVLALTLASGGVAHAESVLINNGLAPPDPIEPHPNVIDDSTHGIHDVYVRNVGCPPDGGNPWDDCPKPWGDPTEVALVDGGTMNGSLVAYESSSITMIGGSAMDLETYDSSSITMTGGSVGDSLIAFDSSSITMIGGSVVKSIETFDSSSITMSGGSVTYLAPWGSSSTITIVGGGFAVSGIPVPYGNLMALNGILTGTLASGDSVNVAFWQGGYDFGDEQASGTIRLVPEPSTAVLVGFGMLGLLAVGRRRRMR